MGRRQELTSLKLMFPRFITREKLEKVNVMNSIDLNYLSRIIRESPNMHANIQRLAFLYVEGKRSN